MPSAPPPSRCAEIEDLRNTARQLHKDLQALHRDMSRWSSVRDCVNDFFETIHLLDRVSDGIQQSVMNMRMLPIGPAVRPVPSRDPRPDPCQRQRHPPGDQRREAPNSTSG